MDIKYQELYKRLIKAYHNHSFEAELEAFLSESKDRENAKQVLIALTGVEEFTKLNDHEFSLKIVKNLTDHRVREKIIKKLGSCEETCETVDGKSKCQSVCPFDAIAIDKATNDKIIDEELCMSCGRCVTACPKNHYMDIPQALPLLTLLNQHEKVFAIVAPAIAGQFGETVSMDQLREAFIKVGFIDMVEVAMGADVLSLKEALEYKKMVKQEGDFMITSCCCPMWIALLKKNYKQLIPEISPSVSPMIAMARIIKKLDAEAKVVFIGPCIAKKQEAKEADIKDAVDYVLTFEETKLIFEAFSLDPAKLKGLATVDYASAGGRSYGRSGGVTQAVWDAIDELCPEKRALFTSAKVSGMMECKKMLNDLLEGNVRASFIEGMGCKGGCVGGPKRNIPTDEGRVCLEKEAKDAAIKMPAHSEILTSLLNQIGIHSLCELRDEHSMFERKF